MKKILKAKCPCCGAEGTEIQIEFLADECKHVNDRGWVEEEAKGHNVGSKNKTWVSSCIHKTGKKRKLFTSNFEYECECTMPFEE